MNLDEHWQLRAALSESGQLPPPEAVRVRRRCSTIFAPQPVADKQDNETVRLYAVPLRLNTNWLLAVERAAYAIKVDVQAGTCRPGSATCQHRFSLILPALCGQRNAAADPGGVKLLVNDLAWQDNGPL
ncbi:hypothetical protein KCP78_10965 [Salmonella enterica subsp. enterica]|nr:hypothetical protein KCP78_10965 [Salmonella enterica subsp. enterica]